MTAKTCHDCHRPIHSAEAQLHGRGSQCQREYLATLGIKPAKAIRCGRRVWVAVMEGQQELQLEVTP